MSSRSVRKQYVTLHSYINNVFFFRKELAEAAAAVTEETNEEETEEVASYVEIEKLQELGVNAGDINKLKAGVLSFSTSFALTFIKGNSYRVRRTYEVCLSLKAT
jgi:hypothetical protein